MIIRVGHRPRYTVIDNVAVEDHALSFRALGLLVFLLSKPDHWEVRYRHLAELGREGQHSVRVTLRELEQAGYLVRERHHDPVTGKWTWVSTVYERPLATAVDNQPAPCGDSRGVVERGIEDRGRAGRRSSVKTDQLGPDEQILTTTDRLGPSSEAREAGIPHPDARAMLAEARAALHGGAR